MWKGKDDEAICYAGSGERKRLKSISCRRDRVFDEVKHKNDNDAPVDAAPFADPGSCGGDCSISLCMCLTSQCCPFLPSCPNHGPGNSCNPPSTDPCLLGAEG